MKRYEPEDDYRMYLPEDVALLRNKSYWEGIWTGAIAGIASFILIIDFVIRPILKALEYHF